MHLKVFKLLAFPAFIALFRLEAWHLEHWWALVGMLWLTITMFEHCDVKIYEASLLPTHACHETYGIHGEAYVLVPRAGIVHLHALPSQDDLSAESKVSRTHLTKHHF